VAKVIIAAAKSKNEDVKRNGPRIKLAKISNGWPAKETTPKGMAS